MKYKCLNIEYELLTDIMMLTTFKHCGCDRSENLFKLLKRFFYA
jgi:hypothetical protein